jgi:hypothetical protein
MKFIPTRWIYVVLILCELYKYENSIIGYPSTLQLMLILQQSIILYFIYPLWVFRVLIWIVNWVWHVQCQTCDNVNWINGTELNWRLFPLTNGLFNNGRLQDVTGQKTTSWTYHHENFKIIKTVVFNEFCTLHYTLQPDWKLSNFWE